MELVELTLKILSILLLTMVKFLFGPTLGYAAGFPIWLTFIISILGMMMAVFLFTYIGDFIRDRFFKSFFTQKKTFTKRKRFIVTIWRKYGVYGVALLTPVFFTPIPGTLVLVSFRTPNKVIFTSMLISAVLWSLIFTYIVYRLGTEYLPV